MKDAPIFTILASVATLWMMNELIPMFPAVGISVVIGYYIGLNKDKLT